MSAPPHDAERAAWLRVLALSAWPDVERLTASFDPARFSVLRAPESGLLMLRGRMGGDGAAFNFGEAIVTRCALRSPRGFEGHGYVLGRNAGHAQRMAVCDALLQDADTAPRVHADVIAPLNALIAGRRRNSAQKAAATRVEFFTMVRGDV